MGVAGHNDPLIGETTCGSLLQQLQLIWDEVGETDDDRDNMLLQLEQECLDVYRRKVDQASNSRALLLQQLANAKSELSRVLCALGELSVSGIPDKTNGTIKEQLAAISPFLEKLCREKDKRVREFADVQLQIQTIRGEIAGSLQVGEHMETPRVNEGDLSTKKLNEFLYELQVLQKEKSNRLHKILDLVSSVHDLCSVLGMDFLSTVTEVHPSLNDSVGAESKSISDATLSKLSKMVIELKEEKLKRLEKIQALASQLTDLWNLMDTSVEERHLFHHVTCNMSSILDEVTVPGALDLDLIKQAELEVERLDQLKASRMKDIAFKRQTELEDIYAQAHIAIDTSAARDRILTVIDSSMFEPSELLADMENQILKAKEEALSRKDILEKVDRWMSACEEESWLEDYSRDDNRYSATRGAHLNLKRAEKARVLVSKIPAIVDTLMTKTRAWEQEHGTPFNYDGVHLLAMLDEYKILRQEKEEEKRRMRDQKKINDQLAAEQEKLFGSKPSPVRPQSSRKMPGPRANGGAANGTPNRRLSVHQNGGGRSVSRDGRRDSGRPAAPVNYVAICKEEFSNNTVASSP
ncbi:65-kDa microtubule-associated protein 1 [Oryza brachyantha]|uniref:Microtubule-associated protein MAP65-1a n=1 Tax=Oryza brachyantha TaxID=4533 RepID=C0JAE3_ORYBR|nr:65-kDa microtubule-associated protein 1 [Oryza brachyantha]XP_015693723.1 65-kDa microtubule-associated protein 1 [Oryza brachyantha]ACN85324.1 microtubule-associated protein MAP65-1a [Oryza brachyantha]